MFIRVSRFSRNVAILLTHEGLGNKTLLFPLNKMHCIHQTRTILLCNLARPQELLSSSIFRRGRCEILYRKLHRWLHTSCALRAQDSVPQALRAMKPKTQRDQAKVFLDWQRVRVVGGKGGDGQISFLRLWANDKAGPDGGDGGHGGHVIFQVCKNVKDLSHLPVLLKGKDGEKGQTKDCFGKNAENTVVDVPIGTIVRNMDGRILADLDQVGMSFVAARGGAGGHGNTFFKSSQNQAPKISEYGADGEDLTYVLEIRSMAHVGLIGLPNAGKSTLLRAITRAKPKVAPYPFTTVRPHLGMVLYDDHEQIAVADLPGLVADSHKDRGLGITFLKHAERCAALFFILDVNLPQPWADFEVLKYEVAQFNPNLTKRPHIVVANKIDMPGAQENLERLKEKVDVSVIPVSAKLGTNLSVLLREMRVLYDALQEHEEAEDDR